jgi:hypothetical protein
LVRKGKDEASKSERKKKVASGKISPKGTRKGEESLVSEQNKPQKKKYPRGLGKAGGDKGRATNTAKSLSTKQLWLEAFIKCGGNITRACQKANVGRSTVYLWQEADPEIKQAISDVRESWLDLAEEKLVKNIKAGREISLIFFLKCQGKKRGYIDRPIGGADEDAQQVAAAIRRAVQAADQSIGGAASEAGRLDDASKE